MFQSVLISNQHYEYIKVFPWKTSLLPFSKPSYKYTSPMYTIERRKVKYMGEFISMHPNETQSSHKYPNPNIIIHLRHWKQSVHWYPFAHINNTSNSIDIERMCPIQLLFMNYYPCYVHVKRSKEKKFNVFWKVLKVNI